MRKIVVLLAVLTLLLPACRAAKGDGDVAHPDGATPVLQVEFRGGLIGPDSRFGQLPSFTMLGDGRVIQSGAMDAIYPGPLLPPLQQRRLNEEGVQTVLREVAATGLFDESREYRSTRVADAPDTVFTLHADGVTTIISINALGIDVGGQSTSDANAYRLLAKLDERLGTLDQWLPASAWAERDWQSYRADAYRLLVRDADVGEKEPNGIGLNFAAWPTRTDPNAGTPALEGRCQVATGQEAIAWTAAFTKANQLTRWTVGERRYQVQPRPLLPSEPAECKAS